MANTLEIVQGPPRVVTIHGCLACGADCPGEPPFSIELGDGAIRYDLCVVCAFSHRTQEALEAAIYQHLPAITREINGLNHIEASPSAGRA